MATSKIKTNTNVLILNPPVPTITTDSYTLTVPFGKTISVPKSIIPVVSTGTGSRANVFVPVIVDVTPTECRITLWSLGGGVSSAKPSISVYVLY